MANSNDSINDRLKLLEEEIDNLKIQNEKEAHWRKVLEDWIFNRFGFDINVELNKKQPKSSELKENDKKVEAEKDEMLEDQMETDSVPVTNSPEESESIKPSEKTTFTVTTESNTSKINICSTRPSGTNINLAVVAKKPKQDNEKDAAENNESVNSVVTEKDHSTINDKTPSIPEETIVDVPQIPENTEYLVTLKAKNAIKKVEERENCYECKECLQQFDNIYKAEGHARHHFETKFKCIDCPLYFEVEQDLILHAQVVHYKIRKRFNVFTCYIGGCPWTSKSPEALRHHRTLKHSESKPKATASPSVPPSATSDKKESDSDKSAPSKDTEKPLASTSVTTNTDKDITQEMSPKKMEAEDLISFKASKGENSTWQCKVCDKAYSEYTLAKTHVSKSHFTHHFPSNEKKGRHVVCRICKKAFSNDNWLKRHELAEHRSSIRKYALL